MKNYYGTRLHDGSVLVTVNGQPLNPRNDVRNHSPDGFEWGYLGSGPAQLALAIFCDCLGIEEAEKYYQEFKFRVISQFKKSEDWQLTESEVKQHYNEIVLSTGGGSY